MFTFQLVWDRALIEKFFCTMLTICSIDCFFAPATFGLLVVTFFEVVFKWLSNPILYSSLLSRARIPICATSIIDKTLASSSIRLMQFEFPNIEKKMKYSTVFIIMPLPSIYLNRLHPFIHHPILTSSGWKNINRCSCVGIENFWLPIIQCVFLILAMVNKKIRGNYI